MEQLCVQCGIAFTRDERMQIRNKYGDWSKTSTEKYLTEVKIPAVSNQIYKELLNRDADSESLSKHIKEMLSGQLTVEELRENVSKCEERKLILEREQQLEDFKKLKDQPWLSGPDKAPLSEYKIKIYLPIGNTIIAELARQYFWTLFCLGVDISVSITEFTGYNPHLNDIDIAISKLLDKPLENYNNVLAFGYPPTWQSIIEREKLDNLSVNMVGFTTWDCEELPESWLHNEIDQMDVIVVPSEWHKHQFQKITNSRVEVSKIHIGNFHNVSSDYVLDIEPIKPQTDPKSLVFYTTGEWSKRTGIEELITTFIKTFTAQDSVYLYIGATGITETKANEYLEQACVNKTDAPRVNIHVESRNLKFTTLESNNYSLCYVSLNKDENINLGTISASMHNNMIVSTPQNATLEYTKGAFIVGLLGKDTPRVYNDCQKVFHDEKCYESNYCSLGKGSLSRAGVKMTGKWMTPNLDDLSRTLLFVYNQWKNGSDLRIRGSDYMVHLDKQTDFIPFTKNLFV